MLYRLKSRENSSLQMGIYVFTNRLVMFFVLSVRHSYADPFPSHPPRTASFLEWLFTAGYGKFPRGFCWAPDLVSE